MTARPGLRALDHRVVPAAARRLRSLLDGVARSRADAARRVQTALALVRKTPRFALLAVALVALAGTAAAVLLVEPDRQPAASSGGAGTPRPALGAAPGSDVEQYLRQGLDALEARAPDDQVLALVHLSAYLPVQEALDLLGDTDRQRLYLRASTAGPAAEVIEVPLHEQDAGLVTALCRATAQRKADDADVLTGLAGSVEASNAEARADFGARADRAAAEAQAYAGRCATVFAAVGVVPLQPQTTGVVPTGRER